MAASDWSGSGTQADPYVIPVDDFPWWEDIYPIIRGTGTGDSTASATYFQIDPDVSGNYYFRLTNVTPNTQDSEADWAFNITGGDSDQTTNGGTTNGSVTEDIESYFSNDAGTRITFRVYPTQNRDRTDKLYLSFYAPYGSAGYKTVIMTESAPNTQSSTTLNLANTSGFRDVSQSTRTLPSAWFAAGTSSALHEIQRIRLRTSTPRAWVRFGQTGTTPGPDLKEFYRANMPMEIKEVGRGSIKPNVSNTYVIPAIGADSDTSDPYEWNPSSAAISTFLSAINSSRARFEIAFSVPSVQGIVPLTLDSDAELSVTGGTRTAVTSQLRGVVTSGYEIDSELNVQARAVVTSQLRGAVTTGYEIDSELNVQARAVVTSQLRGTVPFTLDSDCGTCKTMLYFNCVALFPLLWILMLN